MALGDDLVANPDRWASLTQPVDEGSLLGDTPIPTAPLLRDAYRGALLRVAADDLTGAVDVEQTMRRLALLADETMAIALGLAERERGAAPCLAVIAMGKCGGRELNYVSDVDVIFVCAAD
jgi:glutamate-ammonia-ligase adenylyltransferase